MQQTTIEQIRKTAKDHIQWLRSNNRTTAAAAQQLIEDLAGALVGETPIDDLLIARLRANTDYEVTRFLEEALNGIATDGTILLSSPILRKLISPENTNVIQHDRIAYIFIRFIVSNFILHGKYDFNTAIQFLNEQKFTHAQIIAMTVSQVSNVYYVNSRRRNAVIQNEPKELTEFAKWLLPQLKPGKALFGLVKTDGVRKVVEETVLRRQTDDRTYWLEFLFDHFPDDVGDVEPYLTYSDYSKTKKFATAVAILLASRNGAKYQDLILRTMAELGVDMGNRYSVLLTLERQLPGKFQEEIIKTGEEFFNYYKGANHAGSYYYEPSTPEGSLSVAYVNFLYGLDPARALARVEQLFAESNFLSYRFFEYVSKKFPDHAAAILIRALEKDPKNLPSYESTYYYNALFPLLEPHDLAPHFATLIDFIVNRAGKRSREQASALIAKMPALALPEAKQLVRGKTVDQRIAGALILSSIKSDEAQQLLNDCVDTESNDDTRDIVLEALKESRFAVPFTKAQVDDMVNKAEMRKKLAKWNEKWIEEANLPKPVWKDQTKLSEREVRFLFYRMKRAVGLNSDIEARQMIHLLDRDRSQAFAKALLKAFQDSNADVKLKYYLTLGGLLGDDEMMSNLNSLFKKSLADARMKMAEYVVGALAMVGTNKALRLVEAIYRKLATKKPNLANAAKEALTAAAQELGITMDELSDRIIPNFEFDGIYKNFRIDGDNYRAFVNTEFKINYFTEDNKVRKSLPASAPKELKAEFKEIEKEINDVVKSQNIRLEKYMVEERRWTAKDWRTFFFENPIMFVYSLKLLWGVYDEHGSLVNAFYASEDTSLYDIADNEVTLEDDARIGILHPIHLDSTQRQAWKDKVYQLSLTTMFPIVERDVVEKDPAELGDSKSQKFHGRDVPKGADFVNTFMVKQQWIKSTGDGGRSEFTKVFKDGMYKAYASIDGPAAYYQGGDAKATVYDISFIGKNWADKTLLRDVPPIFYSEVMSDVQQLLNAK